MHHHAVTSPSSPPISPVRRGEVRGGKTSKLRRGARAFSRNAEQLNAKTTQGMRAVRETQETTLSSRKVALVEKVITCLQKIKHRVIIGFNNMRLFFHFYSGQQKRAELKRSIALSKRELTVLDNQQNRRDNFARAQENFQDGRYGAAAKDTCRAITAGVREGFGRVVNQLDA